MMVFWEEGKISVKELGKKLYLDSGTLTPVLKSLEAKGFVRRYRSTKDERVLIVEITPEGKALQSKVAHVPGEIRRSIPLSKNEAEALYSLLYKILGSSGR